MQKAVGQREKKYKYFILILLPMIVGKRFQVLFHSARCGSFHLSLTVLVRYRFDGSIQDWRVVPPCSIRISRVPTYSGYCQFQFDFGYGTITLYCLVFQPIHLSPILHIAVQTPITSNWFVLIRFRSPLLSESRLISFPKGTEMFHFPSFALPKE